MSLTFALGCGGGSSTTTSTTSTDDDGSSGQSEADDDGPATASDDDATADDAPADDDSVGDDGDSSSAGTTASPQDTGDDTGSTGPSDDTSTGGATNDCTNQDDPCVLELDATAAGQGGVDHFYVYTIGAGDEHVQFTGIPGDYVAWDAAPWSFLCNLMGPCCLSDGATTCDATLVMEGLDLGPGDTAYMVVYSNAPYELTITSG